MFSARRPLFRWLVRLEMTRTNFIYNIIALINNDVISIEDLEDFSDELKEIAPIKSE